jgi:hypothetical protein
MNCPMAKLAKMAMATSPSRLDPPGVAILPTSALGNNNSALFRHLLLPGSLYAAVPGD